MVAYVGVESGSWWSVWCGPENRVRALESACGRCGVVAPRLTTARRVSRRSRTRAPVLVAQFPGYVFVLPDREVLAAGDRYRLRPLVLGGVSARVPGSSVLHALATESASARSPLPPGSTRCYQPGDRVALVAGPLTVDPSAPPVGVVTEVRAASLSVLLAGATLPVVCPASQVALA